MTFHLIVMTQGTLEFYALKILGNVNCSCVSNAPERCEVSWEAVLSGINSTKSPASGTGNVSYVRLMSRVGRVREVGCAKISLFLQ
jgi:hypothetical protein